MYPNVRKFESLVIKKWFPAYSISESPVWDIEIISYFPCDQISFQLLRFFTALRSRVVFI